jgi:tetratricopeptide (TPR) repeat protein
MTSPHGPFPDELELQVAELLAEDGSGPDSYETATRAHHLAKLLAGSGRTDDAAALYRRAIVIKQRVLGPNDPEVATTLHNLALLLKAAGRGDEAESLWAEARAVLNA